MGDLTPRCCFGLSAPECYGYSSTCQQLQLDFQRQMPVYLKSQLMLQAVANQSHRRLPRAGSSLKHLKGSFTSFVSSSTPWIPRHSQTSCPQEPAVCLAGGTGEPPSNGGNKPPSGPDEDDLSGAGDVHPDDDEILSLAEAEKLASAENLELPSDFIEAAQGEGIRKSVLDVWLKLQQNWLTRMICNFSTFFRDRLLYDPRFLFIVGAEIAIDMVCATVAEVRKRGDDFWNEFEFYLSDLLVGLVLDILLVGLMATPAVIGKHHAAHDATGFKKLLARTPKAVFEANTAGEPKYTTFQRIFCLAVKFGEYSLAGIVCGILGQSLANGMLNLKTKITGEKKELENPPIIMTGLTWGIFMGISSNLRYQSIFAVERLVDKTLAQRLPKAPYVISFVLRLLNNVWGGENFIDHARWTGIQPGNEEE